MSVVCPKCGESGNVSVDVDGETLACGGCNTTYTVGEVADLVASWSRVLPWLLAHPARTEAAKV